MNLSIDDGWLIQNEEELGHFHMHPLGGKVYRAFIYRELVVKWLCDELACPRCGTHTLEYRDRWPLERRARGLSDYANYECTACGAQFYVLYDRVPQRGVVRSKIYRVVVERIEAGTAPDLVCLTYDRNSLEIVDLFVVPGSCLRAEYLRPSSSFRSDIARSELPEGRDTWCDIEVDRLNDDFDGGAIVTVIHGRELLSPQEVVEAVRAADELGSRV